MTDDEFFQALRAGDPLIAEMIPMGDGRYCAIKRLLFHWTMIIGQIGDLDGYDDRYCYADRGLAQMALAEWQGRAWADEPIAWHRHPPSGRRRLMGDPARETIAW